MTHTPTPWRIGDAGYTVFGPPNGQPSPATVAHDLRKDNARLIVRSVNIAPKLAETLRRAREALYNVPEVGGEYDQQHSDTHLRAALLIDAALAEWDAQS